MIIKLLVVLIFNQMLQHHIISHLHKHICQWFMSVGCQLYLLSIPNSYCDIFMAKNISNFKDKVAFLTKMIGS